MFRDICQKAGGDLAVVSDQSIQFYLRDWHKLYKKPFWIGLSDLVIIKLVLRIVFIVYSYYEFKNGDDGTLGWATGHPAIPSNYWNPGQPKFM